MHIFLCVSITGFVQVSYKGTCEHHVGASIIAKHVDNHDREFVIVRSRGRPKKSKGAQTK